MCLQCTFGSEVDRFAAGRVHILQLLALMEHPDALPPDAVLRLGAEVLRLIQVEVKPLGLRPLEASTSDSWPAF